MSRGLSMSLTLACQLVMNINLPSLALSYLFKSMNVNPTTGKEVYRQFVDMSIYPDFLTSYKSASDAIKLYEVLGIMRAEQAGVIFRDPLTRLDSNFGNALSPSRAANRIIHMEKLEVDVPRKSSSADKGQAPASSAGNSRPSLSVTSRNVNRQPHFRHVEEQRSSSSTTPTCPKRDSGRGRTENCSQPWRSYLSSERRPLWRLEPGASLTSVI